MECMSFQSGAPLSCVWTNKQLFSPSLFWFLHKLFQLHRVIYKKKCDAYFMPLNGSRNVFLFRIASKFLTYECFERQLCEYIIVSSKKMIFKSIHILHLRIFFSCWFVLRQHVVFRSLILSNTITFPDLKINMFWLWHRH